jgi:DNA-directed RNA polymerase specialized sigma24 family protein
LREKERDVLMLVYYGGYTYEEAGRILERPVGTCKVAVHRALGKLRKCIKRYRHEL